MLLGLAKLTLRAKEAAMEMLGTIVAFAIVGGGAVFAGYILYKWMSAARHSHLNWP